MLFLFEISTFFIRKYKVCQKIVIIESVPTVPVGLFQESAEASENKVTEMTSAVSELQKLLKQASEGINIYLYLSGGLLYLHTS